MTIEKVIEELKSIFGNYELDLPCQDSLNVLNETINMLEELKRARKVCDVNEFLDEHGFCHVNNDEDIPKKYLEGLLEDAKADGYNKAIDDFVKRIEKHPNTFQELGWKIPCIDLDSIKWIAEELKGGGE